MSSEPVAHKRLSRPRMPSDPDDDCAMDEFNLRLAAYELQQKDLDFHRTHPGPPPSVSASYDFPVASAAERAEAEACLRQISENAAAGHCPLAVLTKLYAFYGSEIHLKKRGGLHVFAQRTGTHRPSADYSLFETLTGGEDQCEENLLLEFVHRAKNPAAAVAPMLAGAVREGLVRSDDEARLRTKYSSWLAGTSWKKCVISPSHRPSLGTWNGFPWEDYNIMGRGCGLKHGVKWSTIEIQAECAPLSEVVPPELLPCFQLIWSADDGVADVKAACAASFHAACELAAKNKPKTKKRKT